MSTPNHGATLNVLRPATGDDYTANGISARATRLTLVAILDQRDNPNNYDQCDPIPTEHQNHPATPDAPPVAIVSHAGLNANPVIVPVEWDTEKNRWTRTLNHGWVWYMYGGNYAAKPYGPLNDLFTRLNNDQPVAGALPIHDRNEDK